MSAWFLHTFCGHVSWNWLTFDNVAAPSHEIAVRDADRRAPFAVKAIAQAIPRLRVGRLATGHRELAAPDGLVERGEELPAETRAEDLDGEEVAAASGDPSCAVEGEPAAGHDRVQVRMERAVARPGVQHHRDAELGAEALRVAPELRLGLYGGSAEEDATWGREGEIALGHADLCGPVDAAHDGKAGRKPPPCLAEHACDGVLVGDGLDEPRARAARAGCGGPRGA